MLKITSSILFIPFILIYIIPTCGIILSDERKIYLSVFIIPVIAFIVYVLKAKSINRNLVLFYRKTPLKYFMYFYAWLIITGIIAVINGYYSFKYFFIAVIIGFFFRGFLLYLYPMLVFPKFIKLQTLIKFFIIAIYTMLLGGIIEFLASVLNLQVVLDILHIFSNAAGTNELLLESHSSLHRIKAFTGEPGQFAEYITAAIPFIYNFSVCKYRLFKNRVLNLIIKKTMIPFAILCLVLTQSPIGLIIAILTTIYVCKEHIVNVLKKYYVLFVMLITITTTFLLLSNLSDLDISGSFLVRIVNVVGSMLSGSFEEFINVEPSLATRVINWVNQIQLWLKHPVCGVGFLNRGWVLYNQLQNSALPQTFEIKQNINNYSGLMIVNMTMTTQLLYQTGIVGFILHIIYMLKNIKYLKSVSKYFFGLEKVFIISFLQYTCYLFVKPLFYGPPIMNPIGFCSMGILNGLIILAICCRKPYYNKNKYLNT